MSTPADTGTDTPRPIGELVSDIANDLSTLMRQELELAKAEATQSAKRAGKGVGMFGGAGVAGHMVLLFLSIALWWAIGTGTGLGWSALIVAVIWGVIGAILFVLGRKSFSEINGLKQTATTVKEIPNAVKGHEEENR